MNLRADFVHVPDRVYRRRERCALCGGAVMVVEKLSDSSEQHERFVSQTRHIHADEVGKWRPRGVDRECLRARR